MKPNFFLGVCLLSFAFSLRGQATIYTGDSSLNSDRTVNTKNNFLNFALDSNSFLYIDHNPGFVGVNLTNPKYRLDVNGPVHGLNGYFENKVGNGTGVFSSKYDYLMNSQVFGAGYKMLFQIDELEVPRYGMNFYDYELADYLDHDFIYFNFVDRKNVERYYYEAYTGGATVMQMYDGSKNEILKVEDDGEKMFMHLPKKDSRIVISNWGNYLPEHKFIVSGGTSLFEGNVYADDHVGIGTHSFSDDTGDYRLSVNGNIRAHRVRVYTTWADYVFAKDYRLPSLAEVETQIKSVGHLADIPSAGEVEKNGIDVGEMNKLLLQKVEELTLYVIELNKEVEELKRGKKD
jgi:hypothetical protein